MADYGTPSGEDDRWQNTRPYLMQLNMRDELTRRAYEKRDIKNFLLFADSWFLLLEASFGSKKGAFDARGEEILNLFVEVEQLLNTANAIPANDRAARNHKKSIDLMALKKCREILSVMGRLQYDLELIFKKGIDPNGAMFDG